MVVDPVLLGLDSRYLRSVEVLFDAQLTEHIRRKGELSPEFAALAAERSIRSVVSLIERLYPATYLAEMRGHHYAGDD